MNNVKYIIHTVALFIIQLFILDNIQLHSYVYINIYLLAILIIPYTYNKVSVLLLGFLFGMVVDIANNTMGIHAAAATIVAYLRPRLLLSITNRTQINDIKDTRQTSAMDWFFKYAMFLVFIFNVVLIMTETFSFKNISVTLLRIVCSTLVSGFLILLYYFIALKEKQD